MATTKAVNELIRSVSTNPELFVKSLAMRVGRNTKLFGSVMAEHQKEWLAVLAPQFLALANGEAPAIPRVHITASKGSGKDFILSALTLWLCAFTTIPISGRVGASDKDQADELSKSAKDWLFSNPWLEQFVKLKSYHLTSASDLADIEICPADIAGSHGGRELLCIVNETHAIPDGKFEFVHNLLENAAKVQGLVVVATNAGFVGSPAWDLLNVAMDCGWEILEYNQPAPWITERDLIEAKRRNPPSRFARLYYNVWAEGGLGDAFDPAVIKRAIKPRQTINDEWRVMVGVDIGVRNDASAIVAVAKHVGKMGTKTIERPKIKHEWAFRTLPEYLPRVETKSIIEIAGTGRLRVIEVAVWKPELCGGAVDVSEIEQALLDLHRRLNLIGIACDTSQAVHLVQRLQSRNLPAALIAPSTVNVRLMAEATIAAFRDELLDLHDSSEDLITDLCNLRMVEKSYGVRLESPRKKSGGSGTAHGDTASALQLALFALNGIEPVQSSFQGRELICWP
jgi:phage terminase large subunit-like protein